MAKKVMQKQEIEEATGQTTDAIEDGNDTEVLVLADGSELTVPVDFKERSKRAQCIFLKEEYGLSTAQIAKGLGVRYQQVYQALKKVPTEGAEGTRCKICGRILTASQSLAQQVGPICAEKQLPETVPNAAEAESGPEATAS